MHRYDWARLNHIQVGKYAEYFVKMELTLYGFDIYTTEVDDRGIDFVIRRSADRYYDIQVKSARGLSYIFFSKDKFEPRERLYAAVVLFMPMQAPELYLIPSLSWLTPSTLLIGRDYEGRKSKPEWGLQLSQRGYALLQQFAFEQVVAGL